MTHMPPLYDPPQVALEVAALHRQLGVIYIALRSGDHTAALTAWETTYRMSRSLLDRIEDAGGPASLPSLTAVIDEMYAQIVYALIAEDHPCTHQDRDRARRRASDTSPRRQSALDVIEERLRATGERGRLNIPLRRPPYRDADGVVINPHVIDKKA